MKLHIKTLIPASMLAVATAWRVVRRDPAGLLRALRGVGARTGLRHEEPPGPRAQTVAIRSDRGIPSSAIRFKILHPVRASFLCAVSPRARRRLPKSRL